MGTSRNIPRARKELAYLMSYSTPLGKLNCLKRAVRTLMQPVQRANHAGTPLALTTDDLLPMLIFLVVKMEMPNWWANLTYMTSFHFAKSSNHDEYGFYLACLEAALEHVGAGQMESLMDGVETSKGIQLSVSPGTTTLWKRQEADKSAVNCFFECVHENNVRQAGRMLNTSATETGTATATSDPTCLCHPLCTCAKCRPIVGAQERDMERSQATVNSRDERGFTALHLACTCGHMAMTEMLLERGSSVMATDYHGSTPLHMACLKGHQRIALLLLHYDASVISCHDNDGNTPLHMATATGHEDCVKAMLYESKMSQSNIDEKNEFGDTSLHIAAKWGFPCFDKDGSAPECLTDPTPTNVVRVATDCRSHPQ
ncbi:Ankyrin repeat domain-containing protein 27 [Lamellibrachia satsuma]|nr:Ankyrin repeat domain-containing protein 27 [Lamellibrachia satsuma]